MAIQEIEKSAPVGTLGIDRSINEAAMGMVMDIVQAQQYQKPIPSTVRELTANAVDSQSEKEKAIKILKGESKPEEFFIERKGALYEDSKWDESYYDLKYLDQENNGIELLYVEGEGTGRCDKFIVKDYGVGVGARRLKGILEVGYSTKRNRKDALGAFGLGAKVGLATGADYYKMTTVYNGTKYILKIFNKKVNSLIGKFNLETNQKNEAYEFKDDKGEVSGFLYGEKTDELNYTEIEIPCLKHYRYEFETSVKTQLLFFKNVSFHRLYHGLENSIETDFQAEILHNSNNLIIAKNVPYSKPYVVIVNGDNAVGVCYGHIDFKELELEDLSGAIGIKCNIRQVYEDPDTGEEVVVTPGVDVIASREAIRWTPATRDFLLQSFEKAQDEATLLVQEQLKETDFMKWIKACNDITTFSDGGSLIGRLSKIVDLKKVNPVFNNTKIRYRMPKLMFEGIASVQVINKIRKQNKLYDLEYNEADSWVSFDPGRMYFFNKTVDKNDRNKNFFLANNEQGCFYRIDIFTDEQFETWLERKLTHSNVLGDKAFKKVGKGKDLFNTPKDLKEFEKKKEKLRSKLIANRNKILNLFKECEDYTSYEDVIVPEDFTINLIKQEEETKTKNKIQLLTNKERRDLEERLVLNTLVCKNSGYSSQHEVLYKKSKVEPKIGEIEEFEGDLYYGYQIDDEKMQFAAGILHKQLEPNTYNSLYDLKTFFTDDFRLCSISKSNKKHFKKHSHIDDLFGKQELIKENGKPVGLKIIMDNKIIRWNTARLLKERMGDIKFFNNFRGIDEDQTDAYNEIQNYISNNFMDRPEFRNTTAYDSFYSQFVSYLDNVEKFQDFVEDKNNTAEDISEKAKEFALPNGTIGGAAVDSEMLQKLDDLLNYANPVKALFNHIDVLNCDNHHYNKPVISEELSMFLKEILVIRGVSNN